MPLLLGNNGFGLMLWNFTTQTNYYESYVIDLLMKNVLGTLVKCVFVLNLFKTYFTPSSEGLQRSRTHYRSLDETIIAIEADESTYLLVDHMVWLNENNNNNNNNDGGINSINSKLKYGLSSWPFDTTKRSNAAVCSLSTSKKSLKSPILDLKVLAFAIILAVAISTAVYLLVIESRLPSITSHLDLIIHDTWSQKMLNKLNKLRHNNVDHIILLQTGSRSCNISRECLKMLKEMQNNETEELPYNFIIGGDGLVYEVRGWKYQSGMKGLLQKQSLVIGIIGNFDESSPQEIVLKTVEALIRESLKRRMINRKHYIFGLRRSDHDLNEGKKLFSAIMAWPDFKGFVV